MCDFIQRTFFQTALVRLRMMYIISDSCLISYAEYPSLVTFIDYSTVWGPCWLAWGESLFFCQISDVMQRSKNTRHQWAVSIWPFHSRPFHVNLSLYVYGCSASGHGKGWAKGVCLQLSFSLISSLSVCLSRLSSFLYFPSSSYPAPPPLPPPSSLLWLAQMQTDADAEQKCIFLP